MLTAGILFTCGEREYSKIVEIHSSDELATVVPHFEEQYPHCEYFALVDMEDNEVLHYNAKLSN